MIKTRILSSCDNHVVTIHDEERPYGNESYTNSEYAEDRGYIGFIWLFFIILKCAQ